MVDQFGTVKAIWFSSVDTEIVGRADMGEEFTQGLPPRASRQPGPQDSNLVRVDRLRNSRETNLAGDRFDKDLA
jgi:hypothetical protein